MAVRVEEQSICLGACRIFGASRIEISIRAINCDNGQNICTEINFACYLIYRVLHFPPISEMYGIIDLAFIIIEFIGLLINIRNINDFFIFQYELVACYEYKLDDGSPIRNYC